LPWRTTINIPKRIPENPKMLKGPIVSLKTNQASADATIGSAKMNVETLAA
jgi:hypothetical protein